MYKGDSDYDPSLHMSNIINSKGSTQSNSQVSPFDSLYMHSVDSNQDSLVHCHGISREPCEYASSFVGLGSASVRVTSNHRLVTPNYYLPSSRSCEGVYPTNCNLYNPLDHHNVQHQYSHAGVNAEDEDINARRLLLPNNQYDDVLIAQQQHNSNALFMYQNYDQCNLGGGGGGGGTFDDPNHQYNRLLHCHHPNSIRSTALQQQFPSSNTLMVTPSVPDYNSVTLDPMPSYTNTISRHRDDVDTLLPIANIGRLMKSVLPSSAKIAKQAKDMIRECVTEFIQFIASEASDHCARERRKTLSAADILLAMSTLGFEHYNDALRCYHMRWREQREHSSAVVDAVPYAPTAAAESASAVLQSPSQHQIHNHGRSSYQQYLQQARGLQ